MRCAERPDSLYLMRVNNMGFGLEIQIAMVHSDTRDSFMINDKVLYYTGRIF